MIRKIITTLKHLRQTHEDAKEGRKSVGQDRMGNIYYQYYDSQGTESRRMCHNTNPNSKYQIDPLWEDWVRGVQSKPYSQDELDEIYKNEIEYQKRVHDYERRDADMMRKHRQQNEDKSNEWKPNKK